MAKISIHLQPGPYPDSRYDCDIVIPLDKNILYDPLDRPSANAGPLSRMLCSSAATIEKVMMDRTELVKLLTKEIVSGIIDLLESKDTTAGYTKTEDVEFYGPDLGYSYVSSS